jgi:predicted nucleotidyltransferase
MQPTLPDHLAPAVRAALDEAAAALRRMYGERLHALVLFGSQARGTAHDESDVDVLVVHREPFELCTEAGRTADLGLNLLLRHGVLASFVHVRRSTYANPDHPLMMNVNDEGISL